MLSNKEIIASLELCAQLLELHQANTFKIRAYQSAIFNLEKADTTLASLSVNELQALEGVGKGIAASIFQLSQEGAFTELSELLEQTPEGVVEMLEINGIGPKKVRVLWQDHQLSSKADVFNACKKGELANIKGFGEKTQEKILRSLEFEDEYAGMVFYAQAETLVKPLEEELKNLQWQFTWLGDYARDIEVIGNLELLIAFNDPIEGAKTVTNHFKEQLKANASSPYAIIGTLEKLPIQIHCCTKEAFARESIIHTAAEQHLIHKLPNGQTLGEVARSTNYDTEEAFYTKLAWQFVPAPLREGSFELEKAPQQALPQLVEYSDLKGILHNHSTYSDGKHSLREMAEYCKSLGYEYLGISDHSVSAFYANGLNEHRIIEQHQEIDQLNKELAPFVIYKGIESDILNDGALDYPDEVLQSFDFIVSSIHSNLNMSQEKAMGRLIKAIENPYTTILGHPTGRLLLRREGYPIDHKLIIDACSANGVVIEINASPYRLDLDWRWVNYALEKDVKLAINPDAHAMEGYHDMRYGWKVGRKGGLTKEMTLNALTQKELSAYFRAQRP